MVSYVRSACLSPLLAVQQAIHTIKFASAKTTSQQYRTSINSEKQESWSSLDFSLGKESILD